jgi:hypothetical protein
MPIILAPRRSRQEDHEFKASLGYIVRSYLPVSKREKKKGLDAVAQACNPSYLGGRDGKDYGSSPALGESLQDSISANSCVQCHTSVIPAMWRNTNKVQSS